MRHRIQARSGLPGRRGRLAGAPAVLGLALLAACAGPRGEAAGGGSADRPARPDEAALLASWMTGTFSSRAQAEADPKHFLDVRLVMAPIWSEREDGPWLYVEQAVASALERPYRQRVYRLVDLPDGVRSDVYTLPGDPLGYAGAWARPGAFAALGPDDLELRDGCSIFLRADGDRYRGATVGAACASTLRGAHHATSEVTVERDRLESWDRGFDAAGQQVWGAELGPYAFERVAR